MFHKGKDLAKRSPDIDAFVTQTAAISSHEINGFLFLKRPAKSAGNFFRTKGEVTKKQIELLFGLHHVPSGVKGVLNKKWNEYCAPVSLEAAALHRTSFFGTGTLLYHVYNDLVDNDLNVHTIDTVFVNGVEVDYQDVRHEYLNAGDVVVIFSDDGNSAFGSYRKFTKMPTLEVYNFELRGPLKYKFTERLSPYRAYEDSGVRKALKLKEDDRIVCPRCGEVDCTQHVLRSQDGIYIRNLEAKDKLLYTIQSPLLICDSATEVLKEFAPTVIDRRVILDVWPKEIPILRIDKEDVTHGTCGEDIYPDSVVKVYLSAIDVEF